MEFVCQRDPEVFVWPSGFLRLVAPRPQKRSLPEDVFFWPWCPMPPKNHLTKKQCRDPFECGTSLSCGSEGPTETVLHKISRDSTDLPWTPHRHKNLQVFLSQGFEPVLRPYFGRHVRRVQTCRVVVNILARSSWSRIDPDLRLCFPKFPGQIGHPGAQGSTRLRSQRDLHWCSASLSTC